MQFITLADYLLLPFYVAIIYLIAFRIRNRFYPEGHPWRKYFIQGLTVKIVGALFIGLLYQYYYGGGDTANYFLQGEVINSSLSESFTKWFNLVLRLAPWYDPGYYQYTSQMYWYGTPNSYTVCAVTAVVNLFTFRTFLASSIIFAAISFTGIWAMFRTFATLYPRLVKHIALAVLFVPSTFIWGSGIFKDTLCMFGLGWMIYTSFRMLINFDFRPMNIIMMIVGFYLVAVIKVYILIAFLPALGLWILFTYSHKVKTGFLRLLLKTAVFAGAAVAFIYFSSSFADELGDYSLDNIAKTSTVTRDWINYSSGDQGSAYDLGELDPTLPGMLKKFPLAVNVSLFRPYLWEARKPIVFLNAVEAFLFLFVTLKILFTIGPVRAWRTINGDPNIQFCLIFTLIFAFAVGISSYNFGSLSRYRIPCLPLYALALMLIYYKDNSPEKKILSLSR
jgi:hypothetical protein